MKSLLKPFTVYTGTNFLNQVIPFLLLPVLTRFLSPADYGLMATFTSILSIVAILISMGGTDAIARLYFDRHQKDFNFPMFLSNTIAMNLGSFVVIMVAVLLLRPFMFEKFSIPPEWLLLIPIIGFCSAVSAIPAKMFIFRQRPISYAGFKLSQTLIEIGLSLYLVAVIGLTWKGRIGAMAITEVLFLAASFYIIRNRYLAVFSLKYDYIKKVFSYGAPLIFHSLGLAVLMTADRLFLNRLAGLSDTGIYSVGYSISMILVFLAASFNLAWSPVLYEKLGRATAAMKVKLVKFTYLYLAVFLLAALALVLCAPYGIRILVGEKFYGASKFIFWLSMAWVMYGMTITVANYILYEKKTYLLSIAAVAAVAVSIAANFTLIRINGAVGAAQATFLAFFCRFILTWYFSNKAYPMPWFSFMSSRYALKYGTGR